MTSVEQCWRIKPNNINKENQEYHLLFAELDNQKIPIEYHLSNNEELSTIILNFKIGGEARKQTISIETLKLPLGEKKYFQCKCGKRCSVLYLRPAGGYFACRQCNKLTYEVKTINKKLMDGALYRLNRLNKLMEKSDSIDRVFYAGKPTKRVASFLKLREKWCL